MIYITGATGFIGSRVARGLLARGEDVRCLVRSEVRGRGLRDRGCELVIGDVADGVVHEQALRGASGAIHLAAMYEVGVVDRRLMQRANVEGTRAFLAATARASTPRVVCVSTTAALGPVNAEPSEPRDAFGASYPTYYHETKAEAHRLARAAQLAGQPVIIVCPAVVYGPGDVGPGGSFIQDVLARKLPVMLSTPAWFSYVFVDDVVSGIIAALDRGRLGEVYVLSGEVSSINDFADRVAREGGVKPPPLRAPAALARSGAAVLDVVARATGLRFPITVEGVRTAAADRWLHTHERAARDLGYQPRPLAAGLPETVKWAIAQRAS